LALLRGHSVFFIDTDAIDDVVVDAGRISVQHCGMMLMSFTGNVVDSGEIVTSDARGEFFGPAGQVE